MPAAITISANNLSLGYKNEQLINNATFNILEGEFVFISGKSGSGKTTLLRCLYGEFEHFSGELSVLHKDIKRLSGSKLLALRQKMGIVFQDYRLINELSVEENIILPLQIAGYNKSICLKQADTILRHIQLRHKAKAKPYELSGGEQQRIALGRAIIHNPKLIICDEPTGNLDNQSAEIIYTLLEAALKSFKASIIVATHHIPPALSFTYRELKIDSGNIYG